MDMELFIPKGDKKWLTSNKKPASRGGRMAHAKEAKQWREEANEIAFTSNAPVCQQKVWIEAFTIRDREGRYDPQNWLPTLKPIVDGIVDAGLLEDDDYTRVEGPFCRHGGKNRDNPGIRLTIRSIE